MAKLKKGDTVKVIKGKDRGKQEKIVTVFPGEHQLIVEKVNLVKRHTKPQQGHAGSIVEKSIPINSANVMLVCPSCSKPTRVAFKQVKDQKVRVCKKCGENIDK